jgi:hypothetical protein
MLREILFVVHRIKTQNGNMDNNARPIFNVCYLLPIFKDFAEAIHAGLLDLGFTSFFNQSTIINEATNIIFGAHLINDQRNFPAGSIIFNLEQLESDSQYCNARYFDCLATHAVWDYSPRNIAYLKNKNINPAAMLIPLGFSPSVCRIEKPEIQDIDVLFYGAINDRRKKILDDLNAAGLNAVSLIGVYGAELDQYIARSKTVLNLHFHTSKIFEVVRVGFLLNNKKAVVSEVDSDTEIDPVLRGAISGVPYDQLVQTLIKLVKDDHLRSQVEENGFRIFSQRTQSDILKKALIYE